MEKISILELADKERVLKFDYKTYDIFPNAFLIDEPKIEIFETLVSTQHFEFFCKLCITA